jgi:hypothetical protein
MVIGINTEKFFTIDFFNNVGELHTRLKTIPGVMDILSIPDVMNLQNDSVNHRLITRRIFHYPYTSQALLDSDRAVFENLPFYRDLSVTIQKHIVILWVLRLIKTPSTARAAHD